MRGTHLRVWLGLAAGLVVIGLVLWLPAPRRPAGATAGGGVGGGTGSASPSPTGPPALASVWPKATPFPIPATLPDGSTYTPMLVVDPSTSIGTATSADQQRTDLAVVPAAGPPRVLQSQLVSDAGSFDGITVTAERIYWMHTVSEKGTAHVTLWTAERSGGPARQLSADVGAPVFYGSEYDVQQVGDRLYWAAARPGHPDQTELRSIALTGGPVTVQVLDGAWALSAWPWLVTTPGAPGSRTRLKNLATGAVTMVDVPANKQISCSPTWCRVVPDTSGGTETDLLRPDGSDRRVIDDTGAAAIDSDVALLDRFEVLMAVPPATAAITLARLSLYDIRARRVVVIDRATTNAGGRGAFIWWSTGDNETIAWHGLDLRTLA
jgi:hypothetical protein